VAALAIALAAVVPASAADQSIPNDLRAESAIDRCLDANTRSTVRMAGSCTRASRQLWLPRFVTGSELGTVQRPGLARDSVSYVRLVNRRTGRCLALASGTGRVGARACDSRTETVWGLISTGTNPFDGVLRLNNVGAFDRGLPPGLAVAPDGRGVIVSDFVGDGRMFWHFGVGT
jgi:hypothetical protein